LEAPTKAKASKARKTMQGVPSNPPDALQTTPTNADISLLPSVSLDKENSTQSCKKKGWKTLDKIPANAFYFHCPAEGRDKVSLWSFKDRDLALAVKEGMELLPPDEKGRQQINNNVSQKIKCLAKPGYTGMKEHLKTCVLWQSQVGGLYDENENNRKFTSLPLEKVPPLYREHRVVMKKNGLHNLSREDKKKLENQRQKTNRKLLKKLVDALVDNWDEDFAQYLSEKCGIT
jgi:hypothetical protein